MQSAARLVGRVPMVQRSNRSLSQHTVVFLRHGESIWNLENRYTGWCDVPLTRNGELEAEDTGQLMRERGLKFDVAFTSNLQRAWKTCEIALQHAGMSDIPQIRSWKLNERFLSCMLCCRRYLFAIHRSSDFINFFKTLWIASRSYQRLRIFDEAVRRRADIAMATIVYGHPTFDERPCVEKES